MKLNFSLFTVIFLILFSIILSAQSSSDNANEERFQLAVSYENTGKYEDAGRIYKELYNENPSNSTYFDAYVRVYKEMHKYSDLINDVINFSNKYKNVKYKALLAELYWKTGENTKANEVWNQAIEDNKQSKDAYELIAYDQISLRQYDKAIATLLLGRKNLASSSIFAEQLSRYYALTGDYKNGIEEVILLEKEPSLRGYAQSRLYNFIENKDAIEYIDKRIQKEIDNHPNNFDLYELAMWYYRSTNRDDSALDLCKIIDKLQKAAGRELFYFADQARYDAQYEIAIKAYNYVISMGNTTPYRSSAFYGLSRALEARALDSDTIKTIEIEAIVDSYLKLAKDFPALSQSDESLYRAAFLQFKYLKKNDDAIKILQNLTQKARIIDIKAKASLKLSEIYISSSSFPQAKEELSKILTKYPGVAPEDIEIAKFELAKIEYYVGSLDSAKILFDKLISNPQSPIANDAMEYSGLITENISNIKALEVYRTAELLQIQNKLLESAQKFEEVESIAPKQNISEKALIKSTEIYELMNQNQKSFEILQYLANNYTSAIFTDLVYYKIADYYNLIKNYDEAIKYYKKILVVFPHSIYVEDARKKARKLRDEKKVTGAE